MFGYYYKAIKAQNNAIMKRNDADYVRVNSDKGAPHKLLTTWSSTKVKITYADMYPLHEVIKACKHLDTFNAIAGAYDKIIIEGYNDN